jgi:hypothetical protein
LIEVLVAGDDDRLPSSVDHAIGERADHVIGLVSLDGHEGDPEAGQQLADPHHPLLELLTLRFLHRLAVRLVLGVLLGAPRIAGVIDPDDGIGGVGVGELREEADDATGDGGVLAAGTAEGTVAERVVRAEDQRVPVDEVEPGHAQCSASRCTRALVRSKSPRDWPVSRKRPKPVSSVK